MRIGWPGQAQLSLVPQSPLIHGRFTFQDEVPGSSPGRPTTISSQADGIDLGHPSVTETARLAGSCHRRALQRGPFTGHQTRRHLLCPSGRQCTKGRHGSTSVICWLRSARHRGGTVGLRARALVGRLQRAELPAGEPERRQLGGPARRWQGLHVPRRPRRKRAFASGSGQWWRPTTRNRCTRRPPMVSAV
jgi:hypothetical protein